MRVRREVRYPNPLLLRSELQCRFFFLIVPAHRREVLPTVVVITENGNRVGIHGTTSRLVVVLADKVRERQHHVPALHIIHSKIIPISLPIPAALIMLAFDETAELRVTQFVNFSERASL